VSTASQPPASTRRHVLSHLYVQVLIAIVAGGVYGYLDPGRAVALKPLGDGFIARVKMIIGPVIFCTVVARQTKWPHPGNPAAHRAQPACGNQSRGTRRANGDAGL
jgi:hypothetical protein